MLRAKAHHLLPVVSIGTNGLTASVLHEIDVNLTAHELIKVRVFDDDRDERDRLLARVCADLDAAPVQHLGKTLTLWRPSPAPEAGATEAKGKTARASRSHVHASANARRRRHPAGNFRRRQA
jgi:putative YhbY family RNA-binding protein